MPLLVALVHSPERCAALLYITGSLRLLWTENMEGPGPSKNPSSKSCKYYFIDSVHTEGSSCRKIIIIMLFMIMQCVDMAMS